MASVAKRVRDYIANRPGLMDAMKLGIVNYSALARVIGEELRIPSDDAVLAACRRFPIDRMKGYREESVKRVLRKSRVETRTKVATVTVVQGMDVLQRLGDVVEELLDQNRTCRLIQVSQGTVIIVDEDSLSRVTRRVRENQILNVRRGLVEITATSPESVEDTPGLLAYLSSAIASRGINIVQAMSCYTDTIFIVERRDMAAAIEVLTQRMG